MDFDKTSFSVDWFTPGDRYAPKRLSFPKSARISFDDLVSDSPLNYCFSPTNETVPRSCSSIVDTPLERACGWTTGTPPSPLLPSDRERHPMYAQHPKSGKVNSTDWLAPASSALLSIIDECALCGVDLDVSCLDALDEQLLVSPMESFAELCWESVPYDEVTTPVIPQRDTRSPARSFKSDDKRAPSSPLAREYPGSFERARPLAAKITLPLERLPYYVPSFESLDTSLMPQEKSLAHTLYTNPEGPPRILPIQGSIHTPRQSKRRDLIFASSFESLAPSQPPKPCLKPSYSSHALRAVSDACSTFARARRKSPSPAGVSPRSD